MDLKTGYPFWLIKDGLPHTYPKLDKNISTDVLIIGAGISGALMRYHLIKAGISCVIVDARTVGLGSTSCSTSLLQYEIDTPLHQLTDMVGKQTAERAYHLCNMAITSLEKAASEIKFNEFELKDSLYYAAYKKDISFLKKEFKARKSAAFDVQFLEDNKIFDEYGFESPAAILSHHGAQTNAYGFTHQLLQYHNAELNNIYDRTSIVQKEVTAHGMKVKTANGFIITTKKIVYATGYEVVELIDKKIVDLKSTYAIISEQYNEPKFWKNEVMLWNTANPYLYMRTSPDGRIMVGGRDEDYYNPHKRDKLLAKKSLQLENDFRKLFPTLNFKTEFSWAGTFGATKDGLPYIGTYHKMPNCYFALGFGGNGITFSLIAAEIITDLIVGKKNPDAAIFAFERKN